MIKPINTQFIAKSLMAFLKVTEDNRLGKLIDNNWGEYSVCHKINWDSINTRSVIISYESLRDEGSFFWVISRDYPTRDISPERVLEGLDKADRRGEDQLRHSFEFRMSKSIHISEEDKEACWEELEKQWKKSVWSNLYKMYKNTQGSYLTVSFFANEPFDLNNCRLFWESILTNKK